MDLHAEPEAGAVEAAALISLLLQHPHTPVVAIGADGLCVPMPASVPLAGQPVLEARSALDMVVAADRMAVITAWDRVRTVGFGRATVRLASDPSRQVGLHFFDIRPAHGVFLGLFVDDAQVDAGDGRTGPVATAVRPRFSSVRKNELAVVLEVDKATTQILGWAAEDLVGRRSLEFIHPDDQALAIDNWMELLASPGPGRRVRVRHLRSDLSWVWIEITNHNLLDDPDCGYVLAEMADISDEMASQEALRAREQLLHRLAEALPLGVLQVDSDRRIVYANDRLHRIVGVEAVATVDRQLSKVVDGDRAVLARSLDQVLGEGVDGDIEVQLELTPDQGPRLCTMSLRALTDDAGLVTGAIICVADVTESARMRDELKVRATFDMLTGCHNRASIVSALEAILSRTGTRPAAIFVDLDNFKLVNDRWGHAAGDELLTIVAGRLASAVRAGDLVGRIGGDEFLAVCPDISSSAEAMKLARRMAEALRQDVHLATGTVELRASIGVAWAHPSDAHALIADADAAMYEAKRSGGARPVLFSPTVSAVMPL